MEDYTGLVKSLRWLSYMFPETHPAKDDTDRISNNIHLYFKSAADAIEDLSKRETPMKITEIHVDEYFCPACGAENNCDQGYVQDTYCPACGQRLLPESPKEDE